LRRRDIQVWLDGELLRCNAPVGALTPDLRDQLRRGKDEIIAFLRTADALTRQERAIVPLQPHGERIPVFAVAGHNGDVFCYRPLVQQLGDDQPFFGLQPPGVDGQSDPLTSVDDLARYFAGQIRAFRPDSPYVIAGYCAGGTIAFELARQLTQLGSHIAFVALFAGLYPSSYRVLPQLGGRVTLRLKSARTHLRAMGSLSFDERRRYITDRIRRCIAGRHSTHSGGAGSVQVLRAKVQHATAFAVRHYTPPPYDGSVRLFMPGQHGRRASSTLRRWGRVARDIEAFCGPDDCEGDVMLLEPHVRAVAERFRCCRDYFTSETNTLNPRNAEAERRLPGALYPNACAGAFPG
jgi:thioesterase domain-containing protein